MEELGNISNQDQKPKILGGGGGRKRTEHTKICLPKAITNNSKIRLCSV